MAPEMIQRQSCSYEVDIWALGINLYTMLVGHPPFDAPTLDEIYERILRCRYRRLNGNVASKWGRDLLRMLLRREPYLRPSLLIVHHHPFLCNEFAPQALPDSSCFAIPDMAEEEEAFYRRMYFTTDSQVNDCDSVRVQLIEIPTSINLIALSSRRST